MYTRHRTYNEAVEWRCDRRKVCSSRIWIRTGSDQVVKFMAHSHPPDHARVTQAKLARLGIPIIDLKSIPQDSTRDAVSDFPENNYYESDHEG